MSNRKCPPKKARKSEVERLDFLSPGKKLLEPSSRPRFSRDQEESSDEEEAERFEHDVKFLVRSELQTQEKIVDLLNQLQPYFSSGESEEDDEGNGGIVSIGIGLVL